MKLSIIIVNYNTGNLLQKCIASVVENTKEIEYEIIVVDNNSTDTSIDEAIQYFPFVKVIKNSENIGYAKAINQGIRESKGEYISVLNPDTFLKNNVYKILTDFLEENPNIGKIGCKILDENGNIIPYNLNYPSIKEILFTYLFANRFQEFSIPKFKEYDKICEVNVIGGAFALFPRKVVEKIGFFDENFFLYYDDFDLSLRIKQLGYKIYYHPGGEIVHIGGQSSKNTPLAQRLYGLESLYYYFKKHKGKTEKFLCITIVFTGMIIRLIYTLVSYLISPRYKRKEVGNMLYLLLKIIQWHLFFMPSVSKFVKK